MNYKKEWHKQAIDLSAQGLSGRKIAEQLGKSKSQVNDVLKLYNSYKDATGNTNEVVGAKVLFLDLEVSASIVAAFSMFKHFSTPDHIIQFPYILTYAANWLHEDVEKIECYGLNDMEGFDSDITDDYELVLRLWNLLDKADLVVIQNSPFDSGWFTQRCAYHGLPEPSPYRCICTLKGLKKAMALPSNSLGYSTKYFNLGHNKLHHEGISLWIKCMQGDVEAFSKMKEYNVGDIPTLRELYLKIRAYIPNHPNVALYFGDQDVMRCMVCGSDNLTKLDTKAYTNLSIFDAYRCECCGTVKRSGVALNTSVTRKLQLRHAIK